MLALLAAALSLTTTPRGAICTREGRLDVGRLEQRLDAAALSPPSVRPTERVCLAEAASRRLGEPLARALDVVAPGVAPSLALGRAATFQTLAAQLRAMHRDAPAPPSAAPSLPPIDQSEQGFILWQRVEPERAQRVKAFQAYLRRNGVEGVLPIYQLLRTASDWRTCGGEPFATPPPTDWPHVAPALTWIRQRVKPAIGEVEAVSSFREPDLNACAQGAKESAHLDFWAVDLEPIDPLMTRAGLMDTLCAIHKQHGQGSQIGLGFYAGVRFHIDAKRYRHWGFDPVSAPTCAVEAAPKAPAP